MDPPLDVQCFTLLFKLAGGNGLKRDEQIVEPSRSRKPGIIGRAQEIP